MVCHIVNGENLTIAKDNEFRNALKADKKKYWDLKIKAFEGNLYHEQFIRFQELKTTSTKAWLIYNASL